MSNFDFSDLGGRKVTTEVPSSKMDFSDLGGKRISAPSSSMMDTALGLGKGLAAGIGGGALDTAALIYNLPALLHNLSIKSAKQNPELFKGSEYEVIPGAVEQEELPLIPSAVQGIEKGIEEATGIKTPEDMSGIYEGMKLAGELAGTGGIGKLAGKAGMKVLESIGKTLGVTKPTQIAAAVPMGAAIHNVGEEYGPLAGLGAGALTGAASTKALETVIKGLKGIKGTLTGQGETLGEMTIGKAMSRLGEPSERVEHLAKEYNLNLPFNIRLQGPMANFMANNFMNSLFSAKSWKDQIKNTPKDVIDRVKTKIDDIYHENLGRREPSKAYREELNAERERVDKTVSEMYDMAKSYLTEKDKVVPTHTLNAIRGLRKDLMAPVPSEPMKFVSGRVENLAKAWNLSKVPKITMGGEKVQEGSPFGSLDKLFESLSKKPEAVPVEQLIQQRSAFMHDLRNKDAYGVQTQLNRLIKGLDNDISSLKNKKFVDQWRASNDYYKNEVANRIRSDMARALSEGDMPKEAYSYMNSPENIKELTRILGGSPKANEIVNSLKRAKLQDVLISPITNTDQSARFAKWAELFEKGNEKQELLRELLGPERYKDIKEFSKIGEEFYKSGKEFSNFSGTTLTARDYITLTGIPAAVAAGNVYGIGAATGAVLSPWIMSKLLTNPRYTNAAVGYARARKMGKDGTQYQNSMKRLFMENMKKASPYLTKEKINEKE